MRLLPAFLLLVIVSTACAQDNVLLKGYVLDKKNYQPLPFSAVFLQKSQLGTLTGDNGYFELPLPKNNLADSVRISFVSYQSQFIALANYPFKDTLKIFLEEQQNTTPVVLIEVPTARRILLNAIDNLKKNIYRDSIIATGFYRQYHKENGTYVRLIEADVSVAFNTKNPALYAFHEMVRINQQRRSENYETNGDVHGDHLVDLLKENPISYNRSTFLNPKTVDFFAPKLESEDSAQYVVKTRYKESSSEKLEQARIWIEKGTFAILKIEVEKFPNPYYMPPLYAIDSRWKLVNETDIIELEKRHGKFFVSSLQRVYNHHVLNKQTRQVDYIVEEAFEIHFDDFEPPDVEKVLRAGRFSNTTSLYTSKYDYDAKFWKDYDALDDYKLAPQVKTDLEHQKKLEEQFVESGKW